MDLGHQLASLNESFFEFEKLNQSSEVLFDSVKKSFMIIYRKDLIGHYIMGVSTLAVCCVGLIGNVLSIGVLTSKLMRGTTTNNYLIALAASDSLMLLFAIFVAMRDARMPRIGVASWELWKDVDFLPKSYPFYHAAAILFQVCSNWLTVAFTIDRYLMICHPFIAKRFCTIHRSQIAVVGVLIASVCYTIPRFLEYTFFEMNILNHSTADTIGEKIWWYKLSDLGQSESFRNGYHLWSWCILVIGIPSFVIAILNVFLVREINKSIQKMRFEHGAKTRRHETDVMLIGVIIIFFVCQIPSSVSHVLWARQDNLSNASITWLIVNEIGNLLIILNASINIIPYYLFSRKFRQIFANIYFGCRKALASTEPLMEVNNCRIRSTKMPPTPRPNGSLPFVFENVQNYSY